jgi:hypothetical protein
MMGVIPFKSAFLTRILTVSSVSPKYCLRSLCPMMAYSTPRLRSIGALISPVNAPLSAQWTFWHPSLILVFLISFPAISRKHAGGHITTSHSAPSTFGIRSRIRFSASSRVIFIFQFPAMIGLRIF